MSSLLYYLLEVFVLPAFLPAARIFGLGKAVASIGRLLAKKEIEKLESQNVKLREIELKLLTELHKRSDEMDQLMERYTRLKRTAQKLLDENTQYRAQQGAGEPAEGGAGASERRVDKMDLGAEPPGLQWPASIRQVSRGLGLSLLALALIVLLIQSKAPDTVRPIDRKIVAGLLGPAIFLGLWSLAAVPKPPRTWSLALERSAAGQLVAMSICWMTVGYVLGRSLAGPENDVAVIRRQRWDDGLSFSAPKGGMPVASHAAGRGPMSAQGEPLTGRGGLEIPSKAQEFASGGSEAAGSGFDPEGLGDMAQGAASSLGHAAKAVLSTGAGALRQGAGVVGQAVQTSLNPAED